MTPGKQIRRGANDSRYERHRCDVCKTTTLHFTWTRPDGTRARECTLCKGEPDTQGRPAR